MRTILITIICLLMLHGIGHAQEFSDTQIVNAIRLSEGNWNYGILSIKCETEKDCRRICFTTVRHNRIRYLRSEQQRNKSFISFLASRYAPIGVRNDPKGLNKNWYKNVMFFLKEGV